MLPAYLEISPRGERLGTILELAHEGLYIAVSGHVRP